MSLTFTYHLLCMTWNMWHANPNLAEIYDADVSFNVQSKSESCTKERNIKHLKCSNSRLVIFVWGKYVDNFLQTFKISSWFQLLSLFVTQASSSLSLKDNVWEITGDRNLLGVRKKKPRKIHIFSCSMSTKYFSISITRLEKCLCFCWYLIC